MTLQQNTERIQTTHIGSLPRPHAVLDLMKAKLGGKPYDRGLYYQTIAQAVVNNVRKQVECGIDIVTDREVSKPGFFTYVQERLDGFEARPQQKMPLFQKEVAGTEVHPTVIWEKFKALRQGADLATRQLWGPH